MTTHPTAAEILEAVANWIDAIRPQLDARNAYLARVATNGVSIVCRELAQGPEASQRVRDQLASLLEADGDYDALMNDLCERVRAGSVDVKTPKLLQILRADTLARLAIDQPSYRHERS